MQNYALLRLIDPTVFVAGYIAYVAGYAAVNDGGGGLFEYNPTSVQSDNDGTIIRPANGIGRWHRLFSGPVNVKWFGAKGDGLVNDTASVQNANNALGGINGSSGNGGLIFAPAGNYSVTTVAISPHVGIIGDGTQTTRFTSTFSGYVFVCGNDVAPSYGTSISNLSIILASDNTHGINLAATFQAQVQNVYIEGNFTATKNCIGILIDGLNVGSQFTTLINVDVNHIKIGYRITGGTVKATTVIAVGCQAYGDLNHFAGINSVGVDFESGGGHGCIWYGGALEQCGTGAAFAANTPPTKFIGAYFEGNTTDINVNALSFIQTFIGCSGIDNVTQAFGNNFVTNTKVDGTSFLPNRWKNTVLDASADDQVPLITRGNSLTQTADLLQLQRSDGTGMFDVNAAGEIKTLNQYSVKITAGAGTPEGVITAPVGSLYLNTTGGADTCIASKISGSGNTGWAWINNL